MTQTIREQLQALVDEMDKNGIPSEGWVILKLESILATPEAAVTLKPGWIAKDSEALWWFRKKPTWGESIYGDCWSDPDFHAVYLDDSVVDPWGKLHPNGGPECCMEVK